MFGANLLDNNCFSTEYPTGGSWVEAWLRTLSADSCWGANSARRLTLEDLRLYLRAISDHTFPSPGERVQLAGGREVPADLHFLDIMRMVDLVLEDTVLLSTRKGYIGVADEVVGPGDTIVLVSMI